MRTIGGWLAAVALLLVAPTANAEVGIGIFGGVNIAEIKADPTDEFTPTIVSKTFPVGGLVLDFGASDAVSLRLEPMYMQKGATFEVHDDGRFLFESTLRLSYVELPILVKLSRSTGNFRPYLVAGPSVGYRIGARATDPETGEEEDVDEADDTIEKWDAGITAGGGLSFGAGRATLFAEGRYTWGLTNLNAVEEDLTLKNRGVQILAGFTVPFGR